MTNSKVAACCKQKQTSSSARTCCSSAAERLASVDCSRGRLAAARLPHRLAPPASRQWRSLSTPLQAVGQGGPCVKAESSGSRFCPWPQQAGAPRSVATPGQACAQPPRCTLFNAGEKQAQVPDIFQLH